MANKENKTSWYIVPTLVIDRALYRGKGGPRKTDYRTFPSDRDFVPTGFSMKIDVDHWSGVIGAIGENV